MPLTLRVSDPSKTKAVVMRAFFLAYTAAGGAVGMGFLQARNAVTEEQVWNNVASHGDYPGGPLPGMADPEKGEAYGDYVFGRMLKLSIDFDAKDGTITIPDTAPRADYQGWSNGKPQRAADVPHTQARSIRVTPPSSLMRRKNSTSRSQRSPTPRSNHQPLPYREDAQ